jgi:acetyl-CoA carboxylase carboxyl transferase subunit beta
MAWFRKEKKPRQPRRERLEIPPDTWEKCEACGHTDIRGKFQRNANVCPECDYHRRVRAWDYVALLLDEGTVGEVEGDLRSVDPLGFPDYPARLRRSLAGAGDADAIVTVSGQLEGLPCSLGVMDFAFMGGSMGSVVGELITRQIERALHLRQPAIIISASGGARMQEGVLSLMQMAKTSAALARLRDEAKMPYISILTNPTTGGVAASFAMLGDLIFAEPNALVGFAGPRVIEQTIGAALPPGFQTSEYLLEHGMIDDIVPRGELRSMLARSLRLLLDRV